MKSYLGEQIEETEMLPTKVPILDLFEKIQEDDHHEKVLFYEQNNANIFTLSLAKQAFLNYHYIQSLHALGKYAVILVEIDSLIEFIFLSNVLEPEPRTFEKLLFIKADSLYRSLEYDKATDVAEQLVGIDPQSESHIQLLDQIYRAAYNFHSSGFRITALILIFSSSIISAILWMRSSEELSQFSLWSMLIVIGPCLLAMTLLGSAHLYNYLKSKRKTSNFVHLKRLK